MADLMTDSILIRRSLLGSPDAFVEVVQRHEVAIHAYLARRAGHQAADDLLAEVWLRAFAARRTYDLSHDDARPWLYGFAHNVLREHWRATRRTGPAAVEETLDPWDEITDRIDSTIRARTLISAVRTLPSAERDVLLLVAWEQLTPTEAATALGIPPGTARSRLHRARATLRLMLPETSEARA